MIFAGLPDSFESEGYSLSDADDEDSLFDTAGDASDDMIQDDAEDVDLFADLNLDE